MASDERDRMFDKALARHLRSLTPADEAGIAGVSSSQSGACPDPESLAAYHERSLLPEQMNSLKEHIVGCANCQAVLSSLEVTDEIPFHADEERVVVAQAAAAPANTASAPVEMAVPEVRPFKSKRRAILFRGARWQWLAPAGAIAAGLLVYIGLHENRSLPLPQTQRDESKMAEYKTPPPPVPSVREEIPQSSSVPKPAPALVRPKARAATEPVLSAENRAMTPLKQSPTVGGVAGTRPRDTFSESDQERLKDRKSDTTAAQVAADDRADLDKGLRGAAQKKESASADAAKLQAEVAQLQQNAQNQGAYQYNQNVSPRVPGPAPMNQVGPPAKTKSAVSATGAGTSPAATPSVSAPPPAPPEEVNGVVSSYSSGAAMNMKIARAVSNPRLISSPNSRSLWRVGARGLIEFSKDDGTSWSSQSSGVLVDLLTGSAPSDQVCWIIGRAGAILLTTDGGAHWKSVASPLTEDLGGVRAADALRATIWDARGTKSFLTSDGGLTWNSVPHR